MATNNKAETELAVVLRFAMNRQDLTQKQVADLIGVTQPTVSTWLRGLGGPEPDRAIYEKLNGIVKMSNADFAQMLLETQLLVKQRRNPLP